MINIELQEIDEPNVNVFRVTGVSVEVDSQGHNVMKRFSRVEETSTPTQVACAN